LLLDVELGDQRLGCDVPVRVFDDRGDLVPIDSVPAGCVEVDAEPPGERSACGCRRLEESLGFGAHKFFLHAERGRAPERDSAVAVVVVVEVTEGPPISHEEARLAVAQPLVHLGERERDAPQPIEFALSRSVESLNSIRRSCAECFRRLERRVTDAPLSGYVGVFRRLPLHAGADTELVVLGFGHSDPERFAEALYAFVEPDCSECLKSLDFGFDVVDDDVEACGPCRLSVPLRVVKRVVRRCFLGNEHCDKLVGVVVAHSRVRDRPLFALGTTVADRNVVRARDLSNIRPARFPFVRPSRAYTGRSRAAAGDGLVEHLPAELNGS
jgi:hypothetical protein